jgi:hypothetical protein
LNINIWITSVFVFLLSFIALAEDPIWSDMPIAYKRHFEVQTYLVQTQNGPFGSIGHYSTYIIDTRASSANTARQVLYCVFSAVESHALIAHQSAIEWLTRTHAHLSINTDLNNERAIQTPGQPTHRNSRSFDFSSSVNNQTVMPRAESEPTTKRRRSELDAIEEEDEAAKADVMIDIKGSNLQ